MAYGFTYKKNCFYIEDGSGVLNDPITYTSLLRGDSFSSIEEYEQAIALDHEINHYVQELSIYSCISEGFFRDYLAAYARELSKCDEIRFPLGSSDNRAHNFECVHEGNRGLLKCFYEIFDVYDFVFIQNHLKPEKDDYYYSEIAEPIFRKYSLKYNDLLETYAYHKAYWDYYIRNESGEGARLLHEIVEKNNVYPVRWRTDGFEIQNMKRQIEWNKPYQLLNLMTIIGLPFGVSHKEYLDYCEKDIPLNYRNSPSLFINSAQRIILETALNIPGLDFIMSSVTSGKYDKEVFSPVHRFYKILKNIREYGGFPDAVDGEKFFITFYNWAAKQNNWPSYQESSNSIISMLNERANKGEEAITNYQLLAVYHKNLSYGRFAQDIPTNILSMLNLPLLVQTSGKLSVLQLMNNFVCDVSNTLDFYQVMFGTETVIKFKQLNQKMDQKEAFETIFMNSQAAIREILNRLFSEAAFRAYAYNGIFSCPLCKMGCPCATEGCKEFKLFDSVFENCEKKILRFGPIKSYLKDGGGNIEDCMFFNYLLDYKYNINKIQNGSK